MNKRFLATPLQRFSSVPKVLATSLHSASNRPQDAMNIWIEELKEDYFRACLREVKTFDGKHQNLQVVSFAFFFSQKDLFGDIIVLKEIKDFCLEKLLGFYENNKLWMGKSRRVCFLFLHQKLTYYSNYTVTRTWTTNAWCKLVGPVITDQSDICAMPIEILSDEICFYKRTEFMSLSTDSMIFCPLCSPTGLASIHAKRRSP